MKRSKLNRRDFNRLTMAAFGGVVAGSMVGCGGKTEKEETSQTSPTPVGDTSQTPEGDNGEKSNLAEVLNTWSDDKHIEMQKPFSIDQLRLHVDGLKVLNFHPMHVFMNTMSQSHYEGFKRHYLDPEALESFVNRTEDGMGTLFSSLLRNLRETCVRIYTLREIYDQFVAYDG